MAERHYAITIEQTPLRSTAREEGKTACGATCPATGGPFGCLASNSTCTLDEPPNLTGPGSHHEESQIGAVPTEWLQELASGSQELPHYGQMQEPCGSDEGSQEMPCYGQVQEPCGSEEGSQEMYLSEDAEVEALLSAMLHEIADAHPSELVELQWLIECYLLRPQLAYPDALSRPADLGAAPIEDGTMATPMGDFVATSSTPVEEHQPADQAQPECFDVATPTSQQPQASFTIYTPPSSDTECEKARPLAQRSFYTDAGARELIIFTPRFLWRSTLQGPAQWCPHCRSWIPSLDEHRASFSQVCRNVCSADIWSSQALRATGSARTHVDPKKQIMPHMALRSWGSIYKKPRTWQHIPCRVKRQTVSVQQPHAVCLPSVIQKHTPPVDWMIIWRHVTGTAQHARKILAQRIQQQGAAFRMLSHAHAAVHTLSCAQRATAKHPQHTPNLPPSRWGRPKSNENFTTVSLPLWRSQRRQGRPRGEGWSDSQHCS